MATERAERMRQAGNEHSVSENQSIISDAIAELAAAAAAGLSVGERVVVCGLQSDTGRAMNELQGVVVGWIAEKQRWEIHRDGAEAHKTINLKPENVFLIVTVCLPI